MSGLTRINAFPVPHLNYAAYSVLDAGGDERTLTPAPALALVFVYVCPWPESAP